VLAIVAIVAVAAFTVRAFTVRTFTFTVRAHPTNVNLPRYGDISSTFPYG
jgi:hypothetical protein